MKRLRCVRCGIETSASWAFIWYSKQFTTKSAQGKPRVKTLSLCPDCAGDFPSDRARHAFLRRAWQGKA
jgi:hypothetical protein